MRAGKRTLCSAINGDVVEFPSIMYWPGQLFQHTANETPQLSASESVVRAGHYVGKFQLYVTIELHAVTHSLTIIAN